MYLGVSTFRRPYSKILYTYDDDYYKYRIEFSNNNIYVYDFKRKRYTIIYNVDYDIEYIHMYVLYSWVSLKEDTFPKDSQITFNEWLHNEFINHSFQLHCYDSNIDDPFTRVVDFEEYVKQIEKDFIW